jgi:hypothetical protein
VIRQLLAVTDLEEGKVTALFDKVGYGRSTPTSPWRRVSSGRSGRAELTR